MSCSLVHFLFLLIAIVTCLSATEAQEFRLPDPLSQKVKKALGLGLGEDTPSDVEGIFGLAKRMSNNGGTRELAAEVFHVLADQVNHAPSQQGLGLFYSSKGPAYQEQALKYFVMAGENGPHQAALYNAGRIYAEREEWLQALAYMQAAASFEPEAPHYSEKVAENSREGFAIVSNSLARIPLSTRQRADIFLFANLNDMPAEGSQQLTWWANAMTLLDKTDSDPPSNADDVAEWTKSLEEIAKYLVQLWEASSSELSALQAFLLLTEVNDVFLKLAAQDAAYVPAAAGYCEALALSPLCYEQVAEAPEEASHACFDRTVSQAMRLYRQTGDADGLRRITELFASQPKAKREHHDEL